MTNYVIKRLLLAVPVLFGVVILVFFMVRLTPGDPAVIMAGEQASEAEIELIRVQLKLDQPLHIQLGLFLENLIQGDLGRSTRSRAPVTSEIMTRFPNTLILMLTAMAIATLVGVTTGVISAVKQYSFFDAAAMFVALIGISMPVFWLGLLLMLYFSVNLGLLPAAGSGTWKHLILPSIALATVPTAIISRMTRSSVLEVLRQDYIRTARSKGLRENAVIIQHALKNAIIPVITVVGLQAGTLMGGAVLTESVFNWPGLGRLMVDSILARDYPVVQGAVLLLAVVFIFVNLLVDILYALFDPRIRYD